MNCVLVLLTEGKFHNIFTSTNDRCIVPILPLQNPSEMSPERLSNCRACYDIRDLYWRQAETDDPTVIAEVDRQLIDILLRMAEESDEEFRQLGLSKMEVQRLMKHREITDGVRRKLRIYAADITYATVGT